MSSINHFPSSPPPTDTDLFAVIAAVWRQKFLILLCGSVVAVLAAIYGYLTPAQYRVASTLRPVSIKDVDSLNRSGIYSISPESALQRVAGALDSYDVRLAFYRENAEFFKGLERAGYTAEQNFEAFNRESLRVKFDDGSKSLGMPPSTLLELEYPAGVNGVQLLNHFVDFVLQSEKQRIANDFATVLQNRITEIETALGAARANYAIEKSGRIAHLQENDNIRRAQLRDELSALRQQLKTARSDRITQLTEAIGIAKSLGIIKPTAPSALGDMAYKNPVNVIRTEVNYQQIPLYFMGVEALEAERRALVQRKSDEFTEARVAQITRELDMLQSNREIEMLKKRTSEDLFLTNVEGQRSELLRLRALSLDSQALKLVDIDRRAVQPVAPFKPNKSLIVVLGMVLGLILGAAIAVVRYLSGLNASRLVGGAVLDGPAPALPASTAKTLVHD